MTDRRRLVRVPASSANLGPGFDVFAAALAVNLELEVTEAGEFSVDAGGEDLPEDRSNLCVQAFERLHAADGLRFEISSEIPVARGMGSSAAAIVAGLMAADHLYELALGKQELYGHAVELEGHPDNVAAALFGGIALCPRAEDGGLPAPVRLEPPEGVEPVLVVPHEEVATSTTPLPRGEEQQPGGEADPAVPEPGGEVVDERDRHERRGQRREPERQGRRAGEPRPQRHEPEEERGLVGVHLAGAVRDQPLAALEHLEGDPGEPLLVDARGLAPPDAGSDQEEGEAEQQPAVARRRAAAGPADRREGRDGHRTMCLASTG